MNILKVKKLSKVRNGKMSRDPEGGRGRGKGGSRRRGGPSKCICPNCGYEEKHVRGGRCSNKACPECGNRLIGKWE